MNPRKPAAQAAAVIARAMGFEAEALPLPDEANRAGGGRVVDWLDGGSARLVPPGHRKPVRHGIPDLLAGKPAAPPSDGPEKDGAEPGSPPGWIRI